MLIEFQVSILNNFIIFYMFQLLVEKYYKTLFTFWVSKVGKSSQF